MKHIMVDLETLSTKHNAVVLSIGAIEFEPKNGRLGKQFYVNLDVAAQQDAGLHIDGQTVMWWLAQSKEAQNAFTPNGGMQPKQALIQFEEYWHSVKNAYMWSHATFDAVILANLFRAFGMKTPWHYRDTVDIRTYNMLHKAMSFKETTPFNRSGVHHNALDDAIHQAHYCSQMYQDIMGCHNAKENTAA